MQGHVDTDYRSNRIQTRMTQEIREDDNLMPRFVADLKRGAVLTLVLLAGVVVGIAASRWIQKTVHRYHPLVFEEAAREALESGNYQKAVDICTGNLNYTDAVFPSHRLAHLLRSKAYFSLGKRRETIEDIAKAEAYWRAAYHNTDMGVRQELKEFASTVGQAFLKEENTCAALQLFSLAGMGAGEPVDYIKNLTDCLSPQQTAALWSGEPYLIVEDFERADDVSFTEWMEKTGRDTKVIRATITSPVPSESSHGARISASPSLEEGRSWYTIPFFMRMTNESCRIRATIICEKGPPPRLIVGRFFPESGGDYFLIGKKVDQVLGDRHEVEINVPPRQSDKSPCYIVRVGLILPPEECEYLVEEIILLPGDGKESGQDGQE